MSQWSHQFLHVQNQEYKVFMAKNKDYGDAFERHGVIGCLIRIGDKLDRLQTITDNSITYVEDERLEDTLLDLANYATIALAIKQVQAKKRVVTCCST